MPSPKEMLEAAMHESKPYPTPSRPVHEAQIMELRNFAEVYGVARRFEIGTIIRSHKSTPITTAGEPAIVLEIIDPPIVSLDDDDIGTAAYGCKFDLRIMTLDNHGHYNTYLTESWMYEPI